MSAFNMGGQPLSFDPYRFGALAQQAGMGQAAMNAFQTNNQLSAQGLQQGMAVRQEQRGILESEARAKQEMAAMKARQAQQDFENNLAARAAEARDTRLGLDLQLGQQSLVLNASREGRDQRAEGRAENAEARADTRLGLDIEAQAAAQAAAEEAAQMRAYQEVRAQENHESIMRLRDTEIQLSNSRLEKDEIEKAMQPLYKREVELRVATAEERLLGLQNAPTPDEIQEMETKALKSRLKLEEESWKRKQVFTENLQRERLNNAAKKDAADQAADSAREADKYYNEEKTRAKKYYTDNLSMTLGEGLQYGLLDGETYSEIMYEARREKISPENAKLISATVDRLSEMHATRQRKEIERQIAKQREASFRAGNAALANPLPPKVLEGGGTADDPFRRTSDRRKDAKGDSKQGTRSIHAEKKDDKRASLEGKPEEERKVLLSEFKFTGENQKRSENLETWMRHWGTDDPYVAAALLSDPGSPLPVYHPVTGGLVPVEVRNQLKESRDDIALRDARRERALRGETQKQSFWTGRVTEITPEEARIEAEQSFVKSQVEKDIARNRKEFQETLTKRLDQEVDRLISEEGVPGLIEAATTVLSPLNEKGQMTTPIYENIAKAMASGDGGVNTFFKILGGGGEAGEIESLLDLHESLETPEGLRRAAILRFFSRGADDSLFRKASEKLLDLDPMEQDGLLMQVGGALGVPHDELEHVILGEEDASSLEERLSGKESTSGEWNPVLKGIIRGSLLVADMIAGAAAFGAVGGALKIGKIGEAGFTAERYLAGIPGGAAREVASDARFLADVWTTVIGARGIAGIARLTGDVIEQPLSHLRRRGLEADSLFARTVDEALGLKKGETVVDPTMADGAIHGLDLSMADDLIDVGEEVRPRGKVETPTVKPRPGETEMVDTPEIRWTEAQAQEILKQSEEVAEQVSKAIDDSHAGPEVIAEVVPADARKVLYEKMDTAFRKWGTTDEEKAVTFDLWAARARQLDRDPVELWDDLVAGVEARRGPGGITGQIEGTSKDGVVKFIMSAFRKGPGVALHETSHLVFYTLSQDEMRRVSSLAAEAKGVAAVQAGIRTFGTGFEARMFRGKIVPPQWATEWFALQMEHFLANRSIPQELQGISGIIQKGAQWIRTVYQRLFKSTGMKRQFEEIPAETKEFFESILDFGDRPQSFETAQGSVYSMTKSGGTQRLKAPHMGHDPTDVGLKPASSRTVYVSGQDAQVIGAHGTLSVPEGYPVLQVGERIQTLENRGGTLSVSPSAAEGFQYSTTPKMGLHPVEVWTDEAGNVVKWHAGSEITKISKEKALLDDIDDVSSALSELNSSRIWDSRLESGLAEMRQRYRPVRSMFRRAFEEGNPDKILRHRRELERLADRLSLEVGETAFTTEAPLGNIVGAGGGDPRIVPISKTRSEVQSALLWAIYRKEGSGALQRIEQAFKKSGSKEVSQSDLNLLQEMSRLQQEAMAHSGKYPSYMTKAISTVFPGDKPSIAERVFHAAQKVADIRNERAILREEKYVRVSPRGEVQDLHNPHLGVAEDAFPEPGQYDPALETYLKTKLARGDSPVQDELEKALATITRNQHKKLNRSQQNMVSNAVRTRLRKIEQVDPKLASSIEQEYIKFLGEFDTLPPSLLREKWGDAVDFFKNFHKPRNALLITGLTGAGITLAADGDRNPGLQATGQFMLATSLFAATTAGLLGANFFGQVGRKLSRAEIPSWGEIARNRSADHIIDLSEFRTVDHGTGRIRTEIPLTVTDLSGSRGWLGSPSIVIPSLQRVVQRMSDKYEILQKDLTTYIGRYILSGVEDADLVRLGEHFRNPGVAARPDDMLEKLEMIYQTVEPYLTRTASRGGKTPDPALVRKRWMNLVEREIKKLVIDPQKGWVFNRRPVHSYGGAVNAALTARVSQDIKAFHFPTEIRGAIERAIRKLHPRKQWFADTWWAGQYGKRSHTTRVERLGVMGMIYGVLGFSLGSGMRAGGQVLNNLWSPQALITVVGRGMKGIWKADRSEAVENIARIWMEGGESLPRKLAETFNEAFPNIRDAINQARPAWERYDQNVLQNSLESGIIRGEEAIQQAKSFMEWMLGPIISGDIMTRTLSYQVGLERARRLKVAEGLEGAEAFTAMNEYALRWVSKQDFNLGNVDKTPLFGATGTTRLGTTLINQPIKQIEWAKEGLKSWWGGGRDDLHGAVGMRDLLSGKVRWDSLTPDQKYRTMEELTGFAAYVVGTAIAYETMTQVGLDPSYMIDHYPGMGTVDTSAWEFAHWVYADRPEITTAVWEGSKLAGRNVLKTFKNPISESVAKIMLAEGDFFPELFKLAQTVLIPGSKMIERNVMALGAGHEVTEFERKTAVARMLLHLHYWVNGVAGDAKSQRKLVDRVTTTEWLLYAMGIGTVRDRDIRGLWDQSTRLREHRLQAADLEPAGKDIFKLGKDGFFKDLSFKVGISNEDRTAIERMYYGLAIDDRPKIQEAVFDLSR